MVGVNGEVGIDVELFCQCVIYNNLDRCIVPRISRSKAEWRHKSYMLVSAFDANVSNWEQNPAPIQL